MTPCRIKTAFLPALLVFLVACGEKSPEDLVNQAKIHLAKNETKESVLLLKSALQQSPGSAEARFLLGKALMEGGEALAAELELRKASDNKYPDSEVVPLLAQSLLTQGKLTELFAQFSDKKLGKVSADADLLTTLAIAQAAEGRVAKAKELVDSAIALDSRLPRALLLRARLLAAGGDVTGAMTILDELTRRVPENAEAHFLTGYIKQVSKNDIEGAMVAYRAAIVARPSYFPAHARLLDALVQKGDTTALQAQISELKKLMPGSAEVAFYEVQLAYLKQDYLAGRELAQQLLKNFPDHTGVLRLAGAIEYQLRSFVRAEDYLAKALSKTPEAVPIRRALAQTYLRAGKPQKALDVVGGSIGESDDPALLSVAAEAAMQIGNIDRAEQLFARASKLDPKNIQSRTALALIGTARPGGEESSLKALQSLAASDERQYPDLALIGALMQRSRYSEALQAVEALGKKSTDKAMVATLRGRVHLRVHDVTEARKAFGQALEANHGYFPAAEALATLDLEQGQRQQAIDRFNSVIVADPKSVVARVALANLLMRVKEDDKQALNAMADAIKIDPADPAPRRQLVEYYLRHKDAKQAVAVAREGLTAAPDNPVLLEVQGVAQIAAGDVNQAISSFQRLATVAPKVPYPQVRIAQAYQAGGNKAAALESYKRALQIQPDFNPARTEFVALTAATTTFNDSLAFAKSLTRNKATGVAGLRLEGDLEGARKNWTKAAEAYRAALSVVPQSAELALNMHQALRMGGNQAEADKLAVRWERDFPNDSIFITSLGEQALIRKDWPLAEVVFERIVKAHSGSVAALNNLAWSRVMQKKPGAVAPAERAVQLAPTFAPALDTLALALSLDGKRAKGIGLLRDVLVRQPGEALLRLRLAKLLADDGQRDAAKVELERLAGLGEAFPGQSEVTRLLKTL